MKFLKSLVYLTLTLAFLGAVAGGAGWIYAGQLAERPGPSNDELSFAVRPGDGLSAVAERLETAGAVENADIVKLLGRIRGLDKELKAGEYRLPANASINAIFAQIVDGDVVSYKITIPEGRTTAQILKLISEDERLTGPLPDPAPAEGALLPDTYVFSGGETRADLVQRMADGQADLLDALWDGRAPDLPFSTRTEAVNLASIVEKETGVASERGLIAGVFVNRLRRGIRLQSDPTIIYGISKGEPLFNNRGQRRTLYRSEIDRRTAWNTYQIDGLPQTPICNPGRDAIAAVLNPEDTEFLFFVADGTGGHAFAETNAEHVRNVRNYRRIEAQRIAEERGQ
ncbi:MAG: endolytic transglycosylase MltG [Pseudomonadota bacterium]